MSILDNEGHDPNGLGNSPWLAELDRKDAEIERLQTFIEKTLRWMEDEGLQATTAALRKELASLE